MSSKPIPEESETPAPEADMSANEADGTAPMASQDDDLEADAIEPEQAEEVADESEDEAGDETGDETEADESEPADEADEDAEAGDETAEDTGDDEQVAKTLAAARGVKPDAKAKPAAKKPEPAPEPDELEQQIAAIEKDVDPAVAKVMRALHAQNKALLEQKQANDSDSYNKAVHASFDQMAKQGKHDLYGSQATGKLTPAQLEARKFVHDAAHEKFSRFGGMKVAGKTYEFADAIDAAERDMLALIGKGGKSNAAATKPGKKSIDEVAAQRHKARTPVPRGSTVGRGLESEDPNDLDGSAPPKRTKS